MTAQTQSNVWNQVRSSVVTSIMTLFGFQMLRALLPGFVGYLRDSRGMAALLSYAKSHSNGYFLVGADPRVRPKLACPPGCIPTTSHFKTGFFVILNEVKDLN